MPVNLARTQQFSKLSLIAKQIVEGFLTGLHKSPFHGFSVEFAEHRLYNQGESTKNIDWKLYGKTNKFFTKKYEEETNLRAYILVDSSDSMRFPAESNSDLNQLNKLGFAVYSAAALLTLMQKQRDAFSLLTFEESITFNSDCKNTSSHLHFLISQLEKELEIQATQLKKTDLSSALSLLPRTAHKRSLIIILSDFIHPEGLEEKLRELRHQKHEIVLMRIIDERLEQNLEFTEQSVRFVDNETGESIKLNPHEIKEKYKAELAKTINQFKRTIRELQIDLVDCDINKGFEPLLLSYLNKRKNSRY